MSISGASEFQWFGRFQLTRAEKSLRAVTKRFLNARLERKFLSLLYRLRIRRRRCYDITVFGDQQARLHPFDNLCEKRVFLSEQSWDCAERMLLGEFIAGKGDDTFWFVDVGANVGLYTLFARSKSEASGGRLRALCVEPQPEALKRLDFNLRASGCKRDEIQVAPFAVSSRTGAVELETDMRNRGRTRIVSSASNGSGLERTRAEAHRLTDVVRAMGFPAIDALKIDIEGAEADVLEDFFARAPVSLWPQMILLESIGGSGEQSEALCADRGYFVISRTGMNTVLVRMPQAPGAVIERRSASLSTAAA